MATTQRVQASGAVTWTVVDGDGRVIGPVEEYLEFARQSEYSPNTVRSYARSLALWSTHLERHGRCWDSVALTDFGSFLQAVRSGDVGSGAISLRPARRVADATVAARVRPVMSFYRFHAAMGVKAASFLYEEVQARPGRYLPFLEHVARRQGRQRSRVRVRVQTREVPILKPGQVDALVAAEAIFEQGTGEWSGDLRYRLLWSLLAETGMRTGEALSLQHRDWQPGRGDTAAIHVTPRPHPHGLQLKSGARRVFVGSRLDRLYGDYVWWLCDRGADAAVEDWDEAYIFCNVFREPLFAALRVESVYAHLARMKRLVPGLPAAMTPHWFRHTHATALLLAGTPLHVVSRRLGHRDVQTTTTTYGHVTDDADSPPWRTGDRSSTVGRQTTMSDQPGGLQRNGAARQRADRRDPRLPVAAMFDAQIARRLWDSLPQDCRRDHFDKADMPDAYRSAVSETSAGGPWTTIALNWRGLPEPMTWELAWLVHREVELGRRIHPNNFNAAMRVLRAATGSGGQAARESRSLLHLSPDEWVRQGHAARLRGAELGLSNDAHALHTLRRLQDVLVYPYHRGDWWRLDVWNPQLDRRVPQREHEPSGRSIANFSHLPADWLREAAKWWLSICLETERYTWSSLKSRLDGLKWLQRHLDQVGDAGPALVADRDQLRPFVRGFLTAIRTHTVTNGPRVGQPLAANPHRQILITIEHFYAFMYDHRAEAATTLGEPRWLTLGPEHGVLLRPGDKPRLCNKRSEDMVLEDEVVNRIAEGAELLALPAADGGLGDLSAFHALLLLIRTGRRVNEVLMMDFEPLLPLVATQPGGESGLVARMRYQQTKVQAGQPNSIPVDAEIVAIIRAQQVESRAHMARMGWLADREPRYLFLRARENRNGQHPYSAASLHAILGRLSERLGLTDSQGRPVRISKTHRFRHTAATNLLNAGVPLHVVMRYFGHVTPEMTMHYAVTLSQIAEREFLRFKKITTEGRPVPMDQGDLYDVLQLDKRADRVLPNGWCMLPPKQVCNRGNACLSCDKFVTDASHGPELHRQLAETDRLMDQRKAAFLTKYGTPMDDDNVWLQGRQTEAQSLRQILLAIQDVTDTSSAPRGAGAPDRPQPTDDSRQKDNPE